jgi:tricorn protease
MRQQCRRPKRRRGRWGSALAYDGTAITIPKDSLASIDGHWLIENEGVAPDIAADPEPGEASSGRDHLLEAGVTAVLQQLTLHPAPELHAPVPLPAYPPAGNVPAANFSAAERSGAVTDR